MSKIEVYKVEHGSANIKQTSVKREWMDQTGGAHAYHCFPVSLANSLGYEISFPEEISFIWDGISGSEDGHVKVLSGHQYVSTGRANATISFNTGLIFKTDEDITMMHMPVPNLFVDGAQAFTTLISTSFYRNPMPVAWKITKANEVITIPANQPVVTLLPIPLKTIAGLELDMYTADLDHSYNDYNKAYGDASQVHNQKGEWTDWYRNAIDHTGKSIGSHELKSIKLKINDFIKTRKKPNERI